jgi:hypothetical protein
MRQKLLSCLKLFVLMATVALIHMPTYAQKPQLSGKDLLCNGESFFAASNIRDELSRLAREDGVLSSGDKFSQVAVSGVPMGTVINQFKNSNPKPRFVVTDGGGIDLMSYSCAEGDLSCSMIQNLRGQLVTYIKEMRNAGVEAFVWMCYPDPQPQMNSMWANLLKGQNTWAVAAKEVIDTTTEPRALWVDLRESWAGHYNEYTNDGIHATSAGGTASAIQFWDAMKADDWAFFNEPPVKATTPSSAGSASFAPAVNISRTAVNGMVTLSFSTDISSDISMELTTVSGRSVITTTQRMTSGNQAVTIPLGSIAPGVYCCKVRSGKIAAQSTLLVP